MPKITGSICGHISCRFGNLVVEIATCTQHVSLSIMPGLLSIDKPEAHWVVCPRRQ
eukprot:TRINITY_DN1141_c0_g1_i1.p3 TRINITY_DN1141_c0_g1~~TRINITY_DN1141_c0_g1_i1.p3  ORF type:complete len:56 (-),score=1.54 TRINITY_DN1141_c0_g1_i1:48-215(-)